MSFFVPNKPPVGWLQKRLSDFFPTTAKITCFQVTWLRWIRPPFASFSFFFFFVMLYGVRCSQHHEERNAAPCSSGGAWERFSRRTGKNDSHYLVISYVKVQFKNQAALATVTLLSEKANSKIPSLKINKVSILSYYYYSNWITNKIQCSFTAVPSYQVTVIHYSLLSSGLPLVLNCALESFHSAHHTSCMGLLMLHWQRDFQLGVFVL